MDDPVERPQEAPEEAGDEQSPPRLGRNRVEHTIKTLRLDLDAAMNGKPWLLLPEDVRKSDKGGRLYPLPCSYSEVKRVADVPLATNKRHESALYIYRARRSVKSRVESTKIGHLDAHLAATEEKAAQFTKSMKNAKYEVGQELARVRDAARETITTLQDLNTEFKAGLIEIAKAYRTGQKLHDKEITTTQFIDAAGKVLTHTRGMANGLADPDTKVEAEDELMKELNRASQERIKRQQDGGGTTH